MIGTLYVVGVGPGDPELLTVKALRILNEIPCLFVPKGKEEGSSIALSIIEKTIDLSKKEIIEAHFPMIKTSQSSKELCPFESPTSPSTSYFKGGIRGGVRGFEGQNPSMNLHEKWVEIAKKILQRLYNKTDVAFITIGDPTIYSTFFYLYDKLLELANEIKIEIIPGVSSINAASARAKLPLGLADDKIAILPAAYMSDIKDILEKFDTVILMKVNKVFERVLKTLEEMNLIGKTTYISRTGMEDEIIVRDIRSVKKTDLNYFSLMIINK
jgi:precorrin-2/cobalt-factor-2 C20-methyltransferase